MSKIILIETSTNLCSVALGVNGKVAASRESTQPRAHASMTAPFINELLSRFSLKVTDCDAVCVSAGPGSYTGLRVGSSTAKGLCFGAGIPLIAVSTLDVLVRQALVDGPLPEGIKYIVPMIDARRMEVYTATYRVEGRKAVRLNEINAMIVEPGCFDQLLDDGSVVFIGDGAAKCSQALAHPNASFIQTCPHAAAMALAAEEAFNEGRFADAAYFEPFYLKDFVATTSKKKLF